MIYFAKPLIGVEEAEAVHQTVLSGWVTQGPKTLKFEQEFSKKIGLAIEKVVECERIGISVVGLEVPHAHVHLIPRRKGDVENPRGGVRHIIDGKGEY